MKFHVVHKCEPYAHLMDTTFKWHALDESLVPAFKQDRSREHHVTLDSIVVLNIIPLSSSTTSYREPQ